MLRVGLSLFLSLSLFACAGHGQRAEGAKAKDQPAMGQTMSSHETDLQKNLMRMNALMQEMVTTQDEATRTRLKDEHTRLAQASVQALREGGSEMGGMGGMGAMQGMGGMSGDMKCCCMDKMKDGMKGGGCGGKDGACPTPKKKAGPDKDA